MKIKFEKIKEKMKKLPLFLFEKRAIFLFLFLGLGFLISFWIFLKYSLVLKESNLQAKEVEKINLQKLDKILQEREERKKEFEKIEEREYKNPFSLSL